MKKLLTILASCCLALATSALAEQDQGANAGKKKQAQPARQARQVHAQPHAPRQVRTAPRQAQPNVNAQAMQHQHGQRNAARPTRTANPEAVAGSNAAVQGARKNRNRNAQTEQLNKQQDTSKAAAAEKANTAPANVANPQPMPAAGGNNNAPRVVNGRGGNAKRPDPQLVQKIKTEHAGFRAQARPEQVPAATFNQNYRINGSDQWQGAQYQTFRSYHPEMHDRGWYQSHYNRVEIIGGGAYYWNSGYWYPAWGYDPAAQYYPYDGPIYVGSRAEPPDRVIADVQAVLQEQGYYHGEVDGLLGPLTRDALAAYQSDNGLYSTAAIDEPTLNALGMG